MCYFHILPPFVCPLLPSFLFFRSVFFPKFYILLLLLNGPIINRYKMEEENVPLTLITQFPFLEETTYGFQKYFQRCLYMFLLLIYININTTYILYVFFTLLHKRLYMLFWILNATLKSTHSSAKYKQYLNEFKKHNSIPEQAHYKVDK